MNIKMLYHLLSGKVPGGLVALPVAWAVLSYIWYTVYRHSGLISDRVLRNGFGVICLFVLFNYGLLWVILRPPEDLVRILVMPLENRGPAEDAWLGRAGAHSVEHRLVGAGDKKKVIFQYEWMDRMSYFTLPSPPDTLRADLFRRLGIRYLVSGHYTRENDLWRLRLEYRDLKQQRLLSTLEEAVASDGIFTFNARAEQEAAKRFGIRGSRDKQRPDLTGSFAAYRFYHQGWDYLKKGHYNEAEVFFNQALKADSNFAQVHIRLCQLTREQALAEKDENQRKLLLESSVRKGIKALRLDNTLGEAYLHLAWTHIFLERYAEAENELKLANHHQPLDARVFYLLSKLDEDRFGVFGFKREAEVLEHALKINPGYVQALEHLIDRYLNRYRKEEAWALAEQLIAVNPLDLNAYLTKSLVFIYFNDWPAVIAACRDILKKDSLNADAYYNTGIAYKAQTEYDSAIAYFSTAARLGLVDAHNYLAAIYEARKEYYAAIKHLRLRVKKGGGAEDKFREEARKNLYRLVHKPGIVVDSNFAFQRRDALPGWDSVQVLYEN